MTWEHPELLWSLLLMPVLVAIYRRRVWRATGRGSVTYPLWLVADAAAGAAGLRRHAPGGLFFLGIGFVLLGLARPVVPWPVPTGWPVVLVMDVSRSMEETDILPTRIDASRRAALEFVQRLPRQTRMALVTFGSHTSVVVPLTTDRRRMVAAIRALTTQLRTQLGTGLLEGVRVVTGEGAGGQAATPDASPGPRAIAVLLSDGRASDGVPPLEAAAEAKRRGVRVYTVGVGTTTDPSRLRSGYWGVLDEPTLRAIASETGGRYYRASEAGRLREIYRDLAAAVGWTRRPEEVTGLAAGLALAALVAAVALGGRVAPLR